MTALGKTVQGVRCFASDVAQGFFEITHNGFALVGLATVCLVATLVARPDLRDAGEIRLRDWLHARHEANATHVADAKEKDESPFGRIELHVWATAVKRPQLAGSPA